MSKDVWGRTYYRWPRRRRSFRRWLADLAWRMRRRSIKSRCMTTLRHFEEDQGVLGVPAARVWWCRVCLSIEWID